jgi:hypothetical protein
MSMSPDTTSPRADDRIVTEISRWLARHVDDDELRERIDAIGTEELEPAQAEAVGELLAELEHERSHAQLEAVARETVEAVALGA